MKEIETNILDWSPNKTTFANIGNELTYVLAGLKNTKSQIIEIIIRPSQRPDLYTGITSPAKGVLFYGPPGNGKTLIARAIANECKCTFYNLSASSLVAKYFGDSEKLIRALF